MKLFNVISFLNTLIIFGYFYILFLIEIIPANSVIEFEKSMC